MKILETFETFSNFSSFLWHSAIICGNLRAVHMYHDVKKCDDVLCKNTYLSGRWEEFWWLYEVLCVVITPPKSFIITCILIRHFKQNVPSSTWRTCMSDCHERPYDDNKQSYGHRTFTIPRSWSRSRASTCAAPNNIATCPSWPHACILPSILDRNGTSTVYSRNMNIETNIRNSFFFAVGAQTRQKTLDFQDAKTF